MDKVRIRFISLIALLIGFALVFALAVGSLFPFTSASAASSYSPSAIFTVGTGSSVTAYRLSSEDEENENDAYVGFLMDDGAKVYYRRNLAYKWYEADSSEGADSAKGNSGHAVYFSMSFSFPAITFETFTLTFESAEENITKDGKTTNELIFSVDEDGILSVTVKNSENQSASDEQLEAYTYEVCSASSATEDFVLSFTGEGETAGEFLLSLTYGGEEVLVSEGGEEAVFTNIGDYYSEYRSSAATTPNTPITFTAALATTDSGAVSQKVFMKSLNGQTFEVTDGTDGDEDDDGVITVTDGTVEDNKAPALVLSGTLYAFTVGQKYSLTYQAIDVLDDTVSVTRRYYIAQKDEENEGTYVHPDESTTDDYSLLTTSTYFLPSDDTDTDEVVYISIRFELDDGTDLDNYVYLSWYAAETATETLTDAEGDKWDYVLADRNEDGPYYIVYRADEDAQENVKDGSYDEFVEAYQKLVTEAAANTSAGSGSYIYLPSLRDLIGSDNADYRNINFSIYYYTEDQTEDSTAHSETSLSYNALKLEVDSEGWYKFRVLATDASGNSIKLYDDDGELVDVTSTNLWDFDEIPEFTFFIEYTGVSIEDAGEQDLGYRDSTYTITDFEIVAIDGYQTEYTLYYIDEDKLEDGYSMPTYATLVEMIATYMDENDEDDFAAALRACLVEISEYNDEYDEDDDEWDDTDNAYYWRPSSSLSFVPQKSGYYVLMITVTDPNLLYTAVTNAYQVIEVRSPLDITPGRSLWLQNNVTSVVLFSISAVLAVIIIVLLVVKPSDQKVEDVDIEKLKGKKKKKKA